MIHIVQEYKPHELFIEILFLALKWLLFHIKEKQGSKRETRNGKNNCDY